MSISPDTYEDDIFENITQENGFFLIDPDEAVEIPTPPSGDNIAPDVIVVDDEDSVSREMASAGRQTEEYIKSAIKNVDGVQKFFWNVLPQLKDDDWNTSEGLEDDQNMILVCDDNSKQERKASEGLEDVKKSIICDDSSKQVKKANKPDKRISNSKKQKIKGCSSKLSPKGQDRKNKDKGTKNKTLNLSGKKSKSTILTGEKTKLFPTNRSLRNQRSSHYLRKSDCSSGQKAFEKKQLFGMNPNTSLTGKYSKDRKKNESKSRSCLQLEKKSKSRDQSFEHKRKTVHHEEKKQKSTGQKCPNKSVPRKTLKRKKSLNAQKFKAPVSSYLNDTPKKRLVSAIPKTCQSGNALKNRKQICKNTTRTKSSEPMIRSVLQREKKHERGDQSFEKKRKSVRLMQKEQKLESQESSNEVGSSKTSRSNRGPNAQHVKSPVCSYLNAIQRKQLSISKSSQTNKVTKKITRVCNRSNIPRNKTLEPKKISVPSTAKKLKSEYQYIVELIPSKYLKTHKSLYTPRITSSDPKVIQKKCLFSSTSKVSPKGVGLKNGRRDLKIKMPEKSFKQKRMRVIQKKTMGQEQYIKSPSKHLKGKRSLFQDHPVGTDVKIIQKKQAIGHIPEVSQVNNDLPFKKITPKQIDEQKKELKSASPRQKIKSCFNKTYQREKVSIVCVQKKERISSSGPKFLARRKINLRKGCRKSTGKIKTLEDEKSPCKKLRSSHERLYVKLRNRMIYEGSSKKDEAA